MKWLDWQEPNFLFYSTGTFEQHVWLLNWNIALNETKFVSWNNQHFPHAWWWSIEMNILKKSIGRVLQWILVLHFMSIKNNKFGLNLRHQLDIQNIQTLAQVFVYFKLSRFCLQLHVQSRMTKLFNLWNFIKNLLYLDFLITAFRIVFKHAIMFGFFKLLDQEHEFGTHSGWKN
jgi:hypothetical protein